MKMTMRPNAPSSSGLCPPKPSKAVTMEAYQAAWLVEQDRLLVAHIEEELEMRKANIVQAEIEAEIDEQDEADFQEWWALYRFDDSVRSDDREYDLDSSSADLWCDSGSDASSEYEII